MLPALLGLALSFVQSAPALVDDGIVLVKGQRFIATVAQTQREQQRGLMYQPSLASDRCMFFLYKEDQQRAITMRNCLISLDVVFVSADGKVVDIGERIPPPSSVKLYQSEQDYPGYVAKTESRHFIEFPVGTVGRLKLKVGDRIGWELRLGDGHDVVGGVAIPKEAKKGAGKTKKQ